MAPDRDSEAYEFSRRAAHATHALLVAGDEQGAPAAAAEVAVYDSEALNTRSAAAALREASRVGLCMRVPPRYWTPTQRARGLRRELEDRYLADTEGF